MKISLLLPVLSLCLAAAPMHAVEEEAPPALDEIGDSGLPMGAAVGSRVGFEHGELTVVESHPPLIRFHFWDEGDPGGGRRYNLPAEGDAPAPEVVEDPEHPGNHALKLAIGPTPEGVKDRLEFRLKTGYTDTEPLRFGQDRWWGWSLYLDPESQPPAEGDWVHFAQLWQPSTVGPGAKRENWQVPGAASFEPGAAGFRMEMVAKSDGRRAAIDLGELTPGAWHRFVFHVKLSHSRDDTDGFYRVWIDGEPRCDETVDIGNYPRDLDGFFAQDAMDIRVGLYRSTQPTRQSLLVDDLWYDDAPLDPAMAE